MRIGIDLLWVRPNKCGGTESFVRNLLDGFGKYDDSNQYILFTAKDNYDTFTSYKKHNNIYVYKCNAVSASPVKRLIWENLFLDRCALKSKIDVMYIPVYSKPWTFGSKIPYITNIADLQAKHYPQYFSKAMNAYMRYIWWYACKTSIKVFTISEWCKKDIEETYPFVKGRVHNLYIPIIEEASKIDFEELQLKYNILENEYFYCVSSMLPHKNLKTILEVIAKLKKKGETTKFVISGIGGKKSEVQQYCRQLDIEDMVVDTGFVSNAERDCLYENCQLFLFPSYFEGFGMPPIEAMRKGKNVVMTKETCLYEVTEGKAVYVDDPLDVQEWVDKIEFARKRQDGIEKFEKYDLEAITRQYIKEITAK